MAPNQTDPGQMMMFRQLLLIALFMLILMTVYETLKQVISPDISIWESHIVTIIFSTVCATTASYFILRKQKEINKKLAANHIESERLRNKLEKTVEELENSLSKGKILSGLLPICASCKKIRDDSGYWNQIESYIKAHSHAEFSHSICPQCADRLYSECHLSDKKDGL